MACRANRISGRQQEPAGTREDVLPVASYKPLESISFTEWRMSMDTIYTKNIKSWTLITFTCFVPENYLLTHEEYDDIPGIKKFFSHNQIKTTNTKRTGGASVKPSTRPIFKFEELIWPVRLVISLIICSFILWIPGLLYVRFRIGDKRRIRMNALILIISGMITGCILHWEIYSSLFRI
jgi:hypothetical protein